MQTFDSSLFISQSYFNNDGVQLYLILQSLCYTLKSLSDTEKVVSWAAKCLPAEKLTAFTTSVNSISPLIKWYKNSNVCFIFKWSCLKPTNFTFTPTNIINIFIIYELDIWLRDLTSDFTLKDCLYGSVKLANNVDQDK